ncbi:MAG TPA: carboxypeptidase regulatory-like domain-containing protein [Gemmatimonadales bacterium]|nr:carboxypeptidase regulatory-like domain-containing protein [Gemmatimonadales bacterium]
MRIRSLQFPLLASALVVVGGVALTGASRPAPAAGSVSGTVTFTGTPPKMRPIDMAKEPACAKEHATPIMVENVVTGPGNAVENVVVYVSAGGAAGAAATTPVRYDQKGCQYLPHVAVMQAGQPLTIYNDDPISHNIHPMPKANPEWNKSQPTGSPPIRTAYAKPEFIPVKCNIHPWMHGYFAVLPTSHSALTGNDGKFELTGLAPGKYTITAWHEKFGTQSQEVTVTGTKAATADFVFKALPY